jgi:hypothetical protein
MNSPDERTGSFCWLSRHVLDDDRDADGDEDDAANDVGDAIAAFEES